MENVFILEMRVHGAVTGCKKRSDGGLNWLVPSPLKVDKVRINKEIDPNRVYGGPDAKRPESDPGPSFSLSLLTV